MYRKPIFHLGNQRSTKKGHLSTNKDIAHTAELPTVNHAFHDKLRRYLRLKTPDEDNKPASPPKTTELAEF